MAIALFKTYPLENNLKMAELVAVGLPSLALKQVAAALGLQPAKVSPMVNITKKTMERRLKDKAKLKLTGVLSKLYSSEAKTAH